MQGYTDDGVVDPSNPFSGMWMEGDSLAPPCGAEPPIIPHILSLSNLSAEDVFYDLGAGDGRICLAASAAAGCRAVGVEIEPDVCERFRELVEASPSPGLLECKEGDLLEVDLAPATVVHAYLLPEGLEAIEAQVAEWLLKDRRRRAVCNTWGWAWGSTSAKATVEECNGTPLFLYTGADVPLRFRPGTQGCALVTGGNRGLGLECVKSLLARDVTTHVVIGCRSLASGAEAREGLGEGWRERVSLLELDVSSAASVMTAGINMKKKTDALDLLVNNAGVLARGAGKVEVNEVRSGDAAVAMPSNPLILFSRAGTRDQLQRCDNVYRSIPAADDSGLHDPVHVVVRRHPVPRVRHPLSVRSSAEGRGSDGGRAPGTRGRNRRDRLPRLVRRRVRVQQDVRQRVRADSCEGERRFACQVR
jgi:hypothetical protein